MTSLSFGQSVKALPGWKEVQAMRMILVDMAGDFVAGYVLGRLAYWHDDSRKGETRLRIEKNGHLWVARGLDDWFLECRLTERQVKRALKILERLGLIVTKIHKFKGECTTHIRIVQEVFFQLWCFHAENPPTMNTFRPRSQEGRAAIENKASRAKKSVLKPTNSAFQNEQKGGFKTDKKADSLTMVTASVTALATSTTRARENFSAQNAVDVVEDFQSFQSPPKTPAAFDEGAAQEEIAQQLLEFAAASQIVLAPDKARALVEGWPAARLDPDALHRALTGDAQRFGLDEPIAPTARRDLARQMVERETARARWLLCVWHAFPQSQPEYHEKRESDYSLTACFIAAWNRKSAPPKAWLVRELARHDAAQRAREKRVQQEAAANRQREFEELRASLSPAQEAELKRLLFLRMEQERPGGSSGQSWGTQAIRAWEAEILFDPARREQVLNAADEQPGAAPAPQSEGDDEAPSLPPIQLDLDVQIAPPLRDLNVGAGAIAPAMDEARLARYAMTIYNYWVMGKSDDFLTDEMARLVPVIVEREWVLAQVLELIEAHKERKKNVA